MSENDMSAASRSRSEKESFTPGPWAVNPVNAQVDTFAGGAPLAVCKLLWPTDLRSEEETEANARLIAAAPDLYAALNLLHDEIADYIAINNLGALNNSSLRMARAALSRARGDLPPPASSEGV